MENIGDIIIEIASIITATGIIVAFLNKSIDSKMGKQTVSLNEKLEKIADNIYTIDNNQCRTYLVEFLSDLENGILKDENQKARACEMYDHYVRDLKGNSYIQHKWDRLMGKECETKKI